MWWARAHRRERAKERRAGCRSRSEAAEAEGLCLSHLCAQRASGGSGTPREQEHLTAYFKLNEAVVLAIPIPKNVRVPCPCACVVRR